MKFLHLCLILLAAGCSQSQKRSNLFLKRELDTEIVSDSIMNGIFSAALVQMNETDIHNAEGVVYRLTAASPINGFYTIRIAQRDSVYEVCFKWKGDDTDRERIGVKHVSFCYEASGTNFAKLLNRLEEIDVSSTIFKNRKSASIENVAADGILYVFEYHDKVKYHVTLLEEYTLRAGDEEAIHFLRLVSTVRSFIPRDMLPKEEDEIKSLNDLLFSIYSEIQ